MKKNYQKPDTELIITAQNLCGNLGGASGPHVDTNNYQQSGGGMSADARQVSIWDDEEASICGDGE